MSKKEKLLERFLTQPKDFHYDEMVKLLGYYGFEEIKRVKPVVQGLSLKTNRVYRLCCTNRTQVA